MRHALLTALFELTSGPYAALKRKQPWNLSRAELQRFQPGSLGNVLGHYLELQDFELMPKLEVHDICHLLTGTPTDVPGEIALQFLLFGNGKRSAYLIGVLIVGSLLFPDRWSQFRAAFHQGSALPRFHDVDYQPLLHRPFSEVTFSRQPLPHGVREHLLEPEPLAHDGLQHGEVVLAA